MNVNRARRISESFYRIHAFAVESTPRGICIHYQGNLAYFVREICFWPCLRQKKRGRQAPRIFSQSDILNESVLSAE
jgi:hypothetical protein